MRRVILEVTAVILSLVKKVYSRQKVKDKGESYMADENKNLPGKGGGKPGRHSLTIQLLYNYDA
jgi:hypothetical protein